MSIYLVYSDEQAGRARISARYSNPWPELPDLHFPGVFVESIPDPESPAGMEPVLMVQLPAETSEDDPILYYDYRALPEPEETQLQKAQKQIGELESRTKLLEYTAQTTGETLDIHEGAIVDVMNLALGGSLRET